jgi:hypothetical protein
VSLRLLPAKVTCNGWVGLLSRCYRRLSKLISASLAVHLSVKVLDDCLLLWCVVPLDIPPALNVLPISSLSLPSIVVWSVAISMHGEMILVEECVVLVCVSGEYQISAAYKQQSTAFLALVAVFPRPCELRSLQPKNKYPRYITSLIPVHSSRKLDIGCSGGMAEWYGVLR